MNARAARRLAELHANIRRCVPGISDADAARALAAILAPIKHAEVRFDDVILSPRPFNPTCGRYVEYTVTATRGYLLWLPIRRLVYVRAYLD